MGWFESLGSVMKAWVRMQMTKTLEAMEEALEMVDEWVAVSVVAMVTMVVVGVVRVVASSRAYQVGNMEQRRVFGCKGRRGKRRRWRRRSW